MARLYDRVLAGDVRPFVPGLEADLTEMRGSHVIVADNVTEYLYAANDQEVWKFSSDFPNLAPPFGSMWIETRRPSVVNSEVYGQLPPDFLPRSWGAMFASRENPDADRDPRWRWLLNGYLFVSGWPGNRPKDTIGPIGGIAMFVDRTGRCTDAGHARSAVPNRDFHKVIALRNAAGNLQFVGGTEESHKAAIVPLLDPFFLAISFMHCKNVKARERVPPEPLSKKWEKKHGRPQVTYKVLDIDPMKKTLESEGEASTNGLKKALHICRGHFAHYPDGLFNRGEPETVWRPQHVRGSASEGAVVKDYNVRSP